MDCHKYIVRYHAIHCGLLIIAFKDDNEGKLYVKVSNRMKSIMEPPVMSDVLSTACPNFLSQSRNIDPITSPDYNDNRRVAVSKRVGRCASHPSFIESRDESIL